MKYYFVAVSYEYNEKIYFASELIDSENVLTLEEMAQHFRQYHPDIKGVVVLNFKKLTKDEYKELKYGE